jgi:uncharacterized protein YeaO (DUF488 family)
MIRTKSVHSPIEPEVDGLRILATRFRGRGLPTSLYDVWMANLGPSERLLASMQAGRITWPEFARRYRAEITESASIDKANHSIKNHGQKFTLRLLQELGRRENVTILCHCAEQERHCHRHLLAKMLSGRIG